MKKKLTDAVGKPIRYSGFYTYVYKTKRQSYYRIVTPVSETKSGVLVKVLLESRLNRFIEVRNLTVEILSSKLFPVPAESVANLI